MDKNHTKIHVTTGAGAQDCPILDGDGEVVPRYRAQIVVEVRVVRVPRVRAIAEVQAVEGVEGIIIKDGARNQRRTNGAIHASHSVDGVTRMLIGKSQAPGAMASHPPGRMAGRSHVGQNQAGASHVGATQVQNISSKQVGMR